MAVDLKTVKKGVSRMKEIPTSFIWEIQKLQYRQVNYTIKSDTFNSEKDEAILWRLEYFHHLNSPYIELCLVSSDKFNIYCDIDWSILDNEYNEISKMSKEKKLFTQIGEKVRSSSRYGGFQHHLKNDKLILFVSFTAAVDVKPCNEAKKCNSKLFPIWLSRDLSRLLDDHSGDLTLTLSMSGDTLTVHKLIVAARSPALAAMLNKRKPCNALYISGVDFDVMQQVVRYMYTDEVVEIEKMADRLYPVACRYGLLGLAALCENSMVKHLTVQNAAETIVLSDGNPGDFKTMVINFAKRHVAEVMASPGFKSMAATHPQLFLEVFRAINNVAMDAGTAG